MSEANVELVRVALDSWNRGDIDGFCDRTSEDVVWLEVAGRPESEGKEQLGRERLRQGVGELFEAWDTYHLEVERLEDLGERVLVVAREVATGRASGMEIDGRWGYLISVENGEITRVEAYRDAQRAVRLAESRDEAPKLRHP